MQVIRHISKDFEFDPFYKYIEKWFIEGSANNLPAKKSIIFEDDNLADYRMVAVMDEKTGRFKYIAAGSALENLYGRELTGQYLDKLYNHWFRKVAIENCQLAMKERLPVYEHRTLSTLIKKIGYHKVIFPVGKKSEVEELVIYILPEDKEIKSREDWENLVRKTPWL